MAGLLEALMAQKQPQAGLLGGGSTMRAIPQDNLLGGLSSGLGAVRDFGNKVNVPYLGGMGDMFVGKSPEEIENWSYGNSPFQTTEMGLPQIKEERKQGLVDALSALTPMAKLTEGLPVGMAIKNAKNPNLNAGLLDKHLSGQKLTPEEMALYEKNGSAMETPQLQRYNLGNANAQGGSPKARARSDGFETAPKKELYHSAKTDWESNIVDPSKSDLGFHLGSLDQASYRAKVFDGGLGLDAPIGGNIIPITKSKYAITLPLKDEGTFRPDVVGLQLEKKKMLDKGYVNKMEADPLNSSDYWKWNDVYAEKMRDVLKQNDYHGAHYENAQEGPGKSFVITDPSIIRSRFAAFDPLRKNSSSLLASGLLGSLLLNNLGKDNNATTQ